MLEPDFDLSRILMSRILYMSRILRDFEISYKMVSV